MTHVSATRCGLPLVRCVISWAGKSDLHESHTTLQPGRRCRFGERMRARGLGSILDPPRSHDRRARAHAPSVGVVVPEDDLRDVRKGVDDRQLRLRHCGGNETVSHSVLLLDSIHGSSRRVIVVPHLRDGAAQRRRTGHLCGRWHIRMRAQMGERRKIPSGGRELHDRGEMKAAAPCNGLKSCTGPHRSERPPHAAWRRTSVRCFSAARRASLSFNSVACSVFQRSLRSMAAETSAPPTSQQFAVSRKPALRPMPLR